MRHRAKSRIGRVLMNRRSFTPRNIHQCKISWLPAAGGSSGRTSRYMLDKYPDYCILVYDKLTYAGNLDNLWMSTILVTASSGVTFDTAAVAEALKTHQIDTIVNFAAESHVDRSIMDPDTFIRPDVTAPTSCWRPRASSNWRATTRSAPTKCTATSTAITAPWRPTRWRRAAPTRPARPAAT